MQSDVTASGFLQTSDGRPVIFLFMPTARNWVRDLGGVDIATLRRHKLQTDIAKVTGKRPYLVVMTFNPTDGAQLVSSVGFDAFTFYGIFHRIAQIRSQNGRGAVRAMRGLIEELLGARGADRQALPSSGLDGLGL